MLEYIIIIPGLLKDTSACGRSRASNRQPYDYVDKVLWVLKWKFFLLWRLTDEETGVLQVEWHVEKSNTRHTATHTHTHTSGNEPLCLTAVLLLMTLSLIFLRRSDRQMVGVHFRLSVSVFACPSSNYLFVSHVFVTWSSSPLTRCCLFIAFIRRSFPSRQCHTQVALKQQMCPSVDLFPAVRDWNSCLFLFSESSQRNQEFTFTVSDLQSVSVSKSSQL